MGCGRTPVDTDGYRQKSMSICPILLLIISFDVDICWHFLVSGDVSSMFVDVSNIFSYFSMFVFSVVFFVNVCRYLSMGVDECLIFVDGRR